MSKSFAVLLLLFGMTGSWGYSASASEVKTMTECPADSVLNRLFVLLQNGQPDEARELFLIRNPDQQRAVNEFVGMGVDFFADGRIRNRVVESFADGRLAICAIEQTSLDIPDKFELEKAFLMVAGENWRLLPQPMDHRSPLNGLSPQEMAAFGELEKNFSNFKREYKANRDQNKK